MSQLSKNSKKINARTMKWMEMMDNGLLKDQALLIKRTRKGIPKAMRIKVWPALIDMKRLVENRMMSYSTVLIKDCLDIYDINLDIPRTFSFETQQILKESLFNVLKALSNQFPEVGYCQGMNFLAMRLLQIMDDDTTFYLLYYIIKKNKPVCKYLCKKDDNFRNPGFVTRQNYVFKILLQSYLPKIYKVLEEHKVDPVLYTTSWFLTLFSKSFPDEKFYRFFQCFLVEGYSFLFKMALALMKLKQKLILKNSMQQNLMLVPNMQFYDDMDDQDLIDAASKYQFTNKSIKQIEEAYSKKHKKEIEHLQKSSKESYEKKIKSPRRVYEWSLEDFKKTEVGLIEFEQL